MERLRSALSERSEEVNISDIDPTVEEVLTIPDGRYLAILASDEEKTTKDGTGKYLAQRWQVVDGPQKGAGIWINLNLKNRNQTAVAMAKRELKSQMQAMGFTAPISDSSEMHNIPISIDVGTRKGSGEFPPQNVIKGYYPKSAHKTVSAAADEMGDAPW